MIHENNDADLITSEEQLLGLFSPKTPLAARKCLSSLDAHAKQFIAPLTVHLHGNAERRRFGGRQPERGSARICENYRRHHAALFQIAQETIGLTPWSTS